MQLTRNETAALLQSLNEVTILTHRRPDGDTFGSAAALCGGLRMLGKRAWVLENPQMTPRYAGLLEGLTTEKPVGTVLAVDIAVPGLFPLNFDGNVALCIDHHGSNSFYAEKSYVEADSAACGELVYLLLKDLGITPTPAIADALYVGLSTDTGCFRYSNTTPRTLRIAAELMELGANVKYWNYLLFEMKSRPRMALERHLAENMRIFFGGRAAFSFLSRADQLRMQISEDDADAIASFPRSLEGVEIGGVLRELSDGTWKISLRSDPALWDSSAVCARLGGGGHRAAAGATMAGDSETMLRKLLTAISEIGNLTITEDVR